MSGTWRRLWVMDWPSERVIKGPYVTEFPQKSGFCVPGKSQKGTNRPLQVFRGSVAQCELSRRRAGHLLAFSLLAVGVR